MATTFTRTKGFRHSRIVLPASGKRRHIVTGRVCCHPASASAAPVVDIGSVPAPVDADAPLLLSLHERCTAADQPFSWSRPGASAAADERSTELRRPAAAVGTLSAEAKSSSRKALDSTTAQLSISPPSRGNGSSTIPASPGTVPTGGAESRPSHEAADSHGCDTSLVGVGAAAASQRATHATRQLNDFAPPYPIRRRDDIAAASPSAELDEYCAETHPGSICCTTTAVEKDTTTSSCTVTLRTTVKLTDTRLHVAPSELEELAWLAARDAAADAVSSLNRQSSLTAGREERHAFVCSMLQDGTIRDAKRLENGFGHVSYLVSLEDKATGKKVRAAFKPRVEGDCEGWHRVPVEVAAYQLNLLLGMDVVPPAVMRMDCDVDWTHYPAGGAFIYWCSAARQLNTVPMSEWSVPGPVLLSDTRILDVLLQNSDRHEGHFLYAEHWADGDYAPQPQRGSGGGGGGGAGGASGALAWRGRPSPVLIDHAAGFRAGAFVCLDHENAFLTGPTRHISARTYLRLRFLDGPSLRSALHGILTDEEVAALLARRDAVLAFFDGLVAEQGYDNVVLEV